MIENNSLNEFPPSDKIVIDALLKYNNLVEILGRLIKEIERENIDNDNWFIFSEKIGRKYLTQAYTLQTLFSSKMNFGAEPAKEKVVDSSSLFSLLRVQLETYSVLFHLFFDNCEMGEKITRFRLWELDGMRGQQKYSIPNDEVIVKKLENERTEINEIISVLNGVSFFNMLDISLQQNLLKNATWRFNSKSLQNKEQHKRRLSIDQMIQNTGIKKEYFDDWYSFTSTHAHTTYWSVIQNDTLTDEEKSINEYVAIVQATFITAFIIKDFTRIYDISKKFFQSLTTNDQSAINWYNDKGREILNE